MLVFSVFRTFRATGSAQIVWHQIPDKGRNPVSLGTRHTNVRVVEKDAIQEPDSDAFSSRA